MSLCYSIACNLGVESLTKTSSLASTTSSMSTLPSTARESRPQVRAMVDTWSIGFKVSPL